MENITYRIFCRFATGLLALTVFLAVLTPPAAHAADGDMAASLQAGEDSLASSLACAGAADADMGAPSSQPRLTSADAAEMGRADASVAALTGSDAYAAMPLDERRTAAGEQLQALADEELIEGGSIYYDEENEMFTFSYACGVLGGVLLRDLDEDLPGESDPVNSLPDGGGADAGLLQAEEPPAGNPARLAEALPEAENGLAQAAQSANSLPQAGEPETRVLTGQLFGFADIYYAFDNTVNSTRYPYYTAMQQSWSEAGLATKLHTNLTVSRMKHIENSDLCVLSMHGSYYTYTYGRLWRRTITAPILILMEPCSWYKDLLYASDLLTHRVIKVNGLYCLLPSFFQHHYQHGELDGTIVFSETCDFFGYDCDCYELSGALLGAGARTVIGFRNTVYSTYSRNVMWDTVNQLIYGATVQQAVDHAMDRYGVNDVIWYSSLSTKRPHALASYPLWVGDGGAYLELPY